MSFNLYFAGSRGKVCDNWLYMNDCNRLYSQLNNRSDIKRFCENATSSKSKLFIDSGAFSAHTKGAEVNVDDYINYVNSLDNKVTIFAQVDKIPGTFGKARTIQEIEEAPAISWENYLYMRERLVSPDKCLPVFHQGEDFKWLDNMLEAKFNGKHIPYIGISPSNDLTVKRKETFIQECFKHIKNSSNPDVKTHAFGMTSLKVLERYPFYSADSTTWLIVAAMGSVMTPWGTLYVSSREYSEDNINCLPDKAKNVVIEYFDSLGFSMQDLSEKNESRALANCMFLKKWADSYQYKPANTFKNKLF